MGSTIGGSGITRGQLGTATVVLIGVLMLTYGYFHPSKIGLYAGLFVTAAGVMMGVLQVVIHGKGREARS